MENNLIIRSEPYGSLVYDLDTAVTLYLNKQESSTILGIKKFPKDLSAPRIVHIEISNRCNKNCSYCYVDKKGEELNRYQIMEMIQKLSNSKVCQITFGGGEPFLREDIFDLLEFCHSINLNCAVTTNGTILPNDKRLKLFKQINVSYHENFDEVKKAVRHFKKFTKVGINFVLNKDTRRFLPNVARLCKKENIELLLLTYKPIKGDYEKMISPSTVLSTAKNYMRDWKIKVAVDGMTCGQCQAAKDFVDISSTGDVYPCSFIRESMGNILKESFTEIWKRRPKKIKCPYS